MITVMGTIAPMVVLHAQPVLTAANGPEPDHTVTMALMENLPSLSSGPNCVWDFTVATQTSATEVQLVSPITAPGGGSFPTATVAAMADGNTNVNFLSRSSDGLQTVGVYNGQTITYSDPLKTMVYPCTYQTTWTDTWQTNDDQGSREYLADGYGTLICDAGTIEGVLRIWSEHTETDTVIAGMQYLDTVTTCTYWSPLIHWPVATTVLVRLYVGGQLLQEVTAGSVIAEIPSGVHDLAGPFFFTAQPNPAIGIIWLECAAGFEEIQVMDALGKQVLRLQVSGQHKVELPLHSLVPGSYVIKAVDIRGKVHVEKFINQ